MSTTIKLDAEVRGLLEEIAQDPRSRLFGRTPPREVVSLASAEPPPMSRARTFAEHHLVRAHGEQVAYWLGCLAIEASRNDPRAAKMNVDNLLTVSTSRSLHHLQTLERSALGDHLGGEDRSLLRSLGGRSSYTEITALARRLRPNEASDNLHGWALLLDGRPDDAAPILGQLLDRSLNSTVRYFAAVNLNFAHYSRGDLRAAIEAQTAAIAEDPEPSLIGATLVNAAIMGDENLARLAATWLGEIATADHPAVRQLCRILEERTMSTAHQGSLRDLARTGGPVTRRIIDAALR